MRIAGLVYSSSSITLRYLGSNHHVSPNDQQGIIPSLSSRIIIATFSVPEEKSQVQQNEEKK